MKKYKNGALALVLAVSLSACGINHGDRMDYNLINSIQRGVTTEAQIRSMFGEPVSVQTNQKLGIKKLVYAYRNDDSMKKSAAGLGGALLGLRRAAREPDAAGLAPAAGLDLGLDDHQR